MKRSASQTFLRWIISDFIKILMEISKIIEVPFLLVFNRWKKQLHHIESKYSEFILARNALMFTLQPTLAIYSLLYKIIVQHNSNYPLWYALYQSYFQLENSRYNYKVDRQFLSIFLNFNTRSASIFTNGFSILLRGSGSNTLNFLRYFWLMLVDDKNYNSV